MDSTGAAERDRLPGDVLASAEYLRWSRPDLTGALAAHRMEVAGALADRDGWLTAAGWYLYAAAATGDGRDAATGLLEALPRWGHDVLRVPTAVRLRAELAVLAHESGEVAAAGALLPRSPLASADHELVADIRMAGVRCSADEGSGAAGLGGRDRSVEADAALSESMAAWAAVAGDRGEIGAAAALLVGAAAARRAGRPDTAISRAVDGVTRLARGRGSPQALTPSGHLAAALAAEWIEALIDVGRPEEAQDGGDPVRDRLVEYTRPTRQLAVLRLTVARAIASDPGHDSDLVPDLERAAQDAAASDVPALEHICCTALGEMYESVGRHADAVESVRLAGAADRRHRERADRFREALVTSKAQWSIDRVAISPAPRPRGSAATVIRRGSEAGGPAPDGGRDGGVASVTGVPDASSVRGPAADGSSTAAVTERTTIMGAVQAAAISDRPDPLDPTTAVTDERPGRDDASSANGDRSAGATANVPVEPRQAVPNCRGAETANGNAHDDPLRPGHPVPGTRGRPGNGAVQDRRSASDGDPVPQTGAAPVDMPAAGWWELSATTDPWATGTWTAGPVPSESVAPEPQAGRGPHVADPGGTGPDRALAGAARGAEHHEPGTGEPPPDVLTASDETGRPETDRRETEQAVAERERVESALADPDTWLATAMAELDRLRGVRDAPDVVADEPVETAHAVDRSVSADADGCVVVLDLALAGERLPADAAAPTVRRLTRRLEDRLLPASRLRDDGPGSVSVVLPGRDRIAAAEWLHRILPGLVDGLAVDAAAGGALLRAAVHDTDGSVGAQILQRLDGTRGRNGAATQGPRAAATRAADRMPPDAGRTEAGVPGIGAADGSRPDGSGSNGCAANGAAANGAAANSAAANGAAANGAAANGAAANGAAANGAAANSAAANGAGDRTADPVVPAGIPAPPEIDGPEIDGPEIDGPGPDGPGPDGPGPDSSGLDEPNTNDSVRIAGSIEPLRSAPTDPVTPAVGASGPVTSGAAPAPAPTEGAPENPSSAVETSERSVTRHGQSGDRRPYLPAGVVVRPGSGGRRHRRAVEPPVHEPEAPDPAPESPDPAPQSPDGLGLADLLAGALAAYRRI